MTTEMKTPVSELLEEALKMPEKKSKKDFVESLKQKRLLCLDRAMVYEQLILELGGSLESSEEEEKEESRHGGEVSIRKERNENEEDNKNDGKKRDTDERGGDKNTSPEATRKDGGPDHRYEGNETPEIDDARHMKHGDDGRGEVRDPKNDMRLKPNLAKRSQKHHKNRS